MRLIQVVYPAIWGRGDVWPELSQRATSGSVMMSVAVLSLKDLQVPGIWATIRVLPCNPGLCCWAWAAAEDHVWVCGPIKVRV